MYLTGSPSDHLHIPSASDKVQKLRPQVDALITYLRVATATRTTGDHEFAVCLVADGKDFADGCRRQSADGNYRDGEALICRVSKVAHTANLFAVCIYRRTAKKSEKTPSGLADGVGVCSPCVFTVDTR